jgi:xanthine dehydrogenase accessory factor
MKQLWDDILAASENSKACLATVIATEGTAPRKEGSKMLIIGGESLKGAVTIGGCIDAQVIAAADEVTRTGEPQLLREELGEEDAFEIGLTCAGALRVLIEPVKLDREISLRLRQALKDGTPFALVTVAGSSLSSIKPASKIMVTSAKRVYGSLGDDRLNSMAANIAEDLLSKALSRTVALDKSFQPLDEPQQAALEIFVEAIGINPDLFIFGASQVAVPVASLASQAGFRVHVVDTRPRFANRERFPTANEILVGFPGEIAREHTFNQFSFALLLGHAAKHDLPVLDVLLRTDVKYIGVLGGARRAAALLNRLGEMGYSHKDIARVKIPVGLDIGAETPEQIAVAIVGELLMVRTGKKLKGGQKQFALGLG